uniref:ABC transporter G family member 21-like n=1 Tax=Dermatophagoides pteronyssinus TaxID=6956 RepID=A0A6P6XUQ0_DERPT|nr:ABC transporter G family member 21-like [Dermatophagoides pteronyssinus]
MGPSGSGKTTFLNILSGRTKPSISGDITMNGQTLNKQLRRRICYVLQQDIFFPNLTLKQTLMYTARLRLPESMKKNEKLALIDKIIEELQLKKCENTIIGDISRRGLSGGEKKRANIACELLTNPSVLLLDEPTSGLDSCTAHKLIQILKDFALKRKKTIVMSIHQPSSKMFYMLDNLLLLTNGQPAYFGNIHGVVPFFTRIGYGINIHYNPAEFILEKIEDNECQQKIIDAAKQLPKLPKILKKIDLQNIVDDHHDHHVNDHHHDDHHHDHPHPHHHHHHDHHDHHHHASDYHHHPHKFPSDNDSGRSSWSDRSSTFSSNSLSRDESETKKNQNHHHHHHSKTMTNGEIEHSEISNKERKWPTSLWTQVKVLTERNYIEARHRMLSKVNWIQTIGLALLVGILWFQTERNEDTMNDIRGWMFFSTTYWMQFGLFQALLTFPPERQVINKERLSGAYRLSAYYIAKMIGELPLTIVLPTVFFIISYPMLGLTSFITATYLWLFLIISIICAQSFGLFIGALCSNLEVSVTISALYSLSTMLFAGYYASIPSWLSWTRYLSIIYYAFQNMQLIEFGGTNLKCSETLTKFQYCKQSSDIKSAYIPRLELESNLDLMSPNTKPLPVWFNTMILLVFLLIFRLMGYLSLRYTRKPTTC